MPCSDGGWSHKEEMESYQKSLNEAKKRLDVATELLCSTMQALEKEDDLVYRIEASVPGLQTWWERHQVEDRTRLSLELSTKMHTLSLERLREIEALLGGHSK